MDILIKKDANIPIYRQITDQIKENVDNGSLKYGSKLPPERELSEQNDISRGTVKKAYEELEKEGYIKIVWGSGAFIQKKGEDDKEIKEVELFTNKIKKMGVEGFTDEEIKAILDISYLKKLSDNKVNIAACDCNYEALKIFKKQLSKISDLNCMAFLISDIEKFNYPDKIFDNFDIIFTTTSHYDELVELLAGNKEKIMKAVVSPDRRTTIKLVNLPENTGLFVKTRRFKDIVNNNLAGYGVRIPERDCIYDKWIDIDGFNEFLRNKKAIIMPPIYTLDLTSSIYDRIYDFIEDGGQIITFNYMIEKGSIIHIEDRISSILYNLKE